MKKLILLACLLMPSYAGAVSPYGGTYINYALGYATTTLAGIFSIAASMNTPTSYNIILNGITGNGTFTGDVGIETTAPSSALQVGAGTWSESQVATFHAGTNDTLLVRTHSAFSAGPSVVAYNDADNALEPIQLAASMFDFTNGNVGIGTSSAGTLLTVGANATAVQLCRCTAGTLTGMYISCTVGTIATFCTSSAQTGISAQ